MKNHFSNSVFCLFVLRRFIAAPSISIFLLILVISSHNLLLLFFWLSTPLPRQFSAIPNKNYHSHIHPLPTIQFKNFRNFRIWKYFIDCQPIRLENWYSTDHATPLIPIHPSEYQNSHSLLFSIFAHSVNFLLENSFSFE